MADHKPRQLPDGRILVSELFLAHTTGRHRRVIERCAEPVACDVRTKVVLFDVDQVAAALAEVPTRQRRVA